MTHKGVPRSKRPAHRHRDGWHPQQTCHPIPAEGSDPAERPGRHAGNLGSRLPSWPARSRHAAFRLCRWVAPIRDRRTGCRPRPDRGWPRPPSDQEEARLVKHTALASSSSAKADERHVQKQLGHASAEMHAISAPEGSFPVQSEWVVAENWPGRSSVRRDQL